MMGFVREHLRFPATALRPTGEAPRDVVVECIVLPDGALLNLRVVSATSPGFSREAMRVVGLMPRWIPGKKEGKEVAVKVVIPVSFTGKEPLMSPADSLLVPSWTHGAVNTPEVNSMPEFPGGASKFYEFLNKNLKYPESSRSRKIQGTVVLVFVVGVDGMIERIRVAKSVSPELDAEAVRVAQQMPPWKPGVQDGVPVEVHYTLPVKFTIKPSPPSVRGF